ncbi:hypothetical protein GCM10025778_05430 [Paeniglutamicibacter antarcticus]|uniref:Uncharacterized protein n=1 Tax=Paeniglutamicibacter antarcticus TaxID=494023 RepID=A0ABP9TJI9_9MICC
MVSGRGFGVYLRDVAATELPMFDLVSALEACIGLRGSHPVFPAVGCRLRVPWPTVRRTAHVSAGKRVLDSLRPRGFRPDANTR